MLKMSLSTDLSASATQIVVEYDGIDSGGGKSVEKLLKSQKIIKKSKNLNSLKNRKCHRFGGTKLFDLRH